MQQLIERMLQLARLESGRGWTDNPGAGPAGQTGARRPPDPGPAPPDGPCTPSWGRSGRSGDPLLVEQAPGNLLDNASISPHPVGSTLVLSGAMEEGACFRVQDQGPGIPGLCAAQDFRAFLLPAKARQGKSSGLGLCFRLGWHASTAAILLLPSQPDGACWPLWLPGKLRTLPPSTQSRACCASSMTTSPSMPRIHINQQICPVCCCPPACRRPLLSHCPPAPLLAACCLPMAPANRQHPGDCAAQLTPASTFKIPLALMGYVTSSGG